MSDFTLEELDVIIIGSGISGLSAGITLLKTNSSILILEGRSRIGGRIFTDYTSFQSELGAGWVQNYDASLNPTVNLVCSLNKTILPFDWSISKSFNRDGTECTESFLKDSENKVEILLDRACKKANKLWDNDDSIEKAFGDQLLREKIILNAYERSYLTSRLFSDEYGLDISYLSAWWWDDVRLLNHTYSFDL